MQIVNFTPTPALIGGLLIGVAVSLFMFGTGRVAGVSGVVVGLFRPRRGDVMWRVAFVAGLFAGGIAASFIVPEAIEFGIERSTTAIVAAGLLVGIGTRLGNGCTSGHGVCGTARLSARSIAATVTFMAAGMITVGLTRLVGDA